MNGINHYLLQQGIDPKTSSNEEIKKAKEEYKRLYNIEYQKKYAKQNFKVGIKLSYTEHRKVLDSAKKHNQKLSTHLKALAFAYLNSEYIVPSKTELLNLQMEIKAIGRNINQLAKRVNTYGSSQFNKLELLSQIDKLERTITDHIENPKKASSREAIQKVLNEKQWS